MSVVPTTYDSKELSLYKDGQRFHVSDVKGLRADFDPAVQVFQLEYADVADPSIVNPILVKSLYTTDATGGAYSVNATLAGLRGDLDAESSTRTANDDELWAEVEANYDTLSKGITGLNKSLGSYVSSLNNTIGSVIQSVSAEANERKRGDTDLGARIDFETYERQQAVGVVQQAVDAEAFTRLETVNALQGGLISETEARRVAITAVEDSVVAEAKLRTDADLVLQGQIIDLISGSTSMGNDYKIADLALESRLAITIDDEKKRAEAREAVIEAKSYDDSQYTQQVKDTLDYYHDIDVKRAIAAEALGLRIDLGICMFLLPAVCTWT